MNFNINITPKANPNTVGEMLRDIFFGSREEKGLGCYQNFIVTESVQEIEGTPIPWHDFRTAPPTLRFDAPNENDNKEDHDYFEGCYKTFSTVVEDIPVTMMYHWDGDGTLIFIFPDGCVVNTDCKKTNYWAFYDSFEEAVGATDF